MFSGEALRLLRELWPDATELAEELYAIFSSVTLPLEHSGPVTLNNPNGAGAGVTLPGYSSGDQILSIPRADGGTITLSLGDNGLVLDGGTLTTPASTTQQQTEDKVFLGSVVSGSGSTYKVNLGNKVVTVTQAQINADETIPAGTKALVLKSGNSYAMQVPVWL